MAKKTLEKHDDLVLHALGNATTISVIAAENLVKNGYADYVKMRLKPSRLRSPEEIGTEEEVHLKKRRKMEPQSDLLREQSSSSLSRRAPTSIST